MDYKVSLSYVDIKGMQRVLHRIALFVLTALLVGASISPGLAALRVGSDVSYAPLEFYTGSHKAMTGFDIDLAHALAEKLGVPITIGNHDFDKLIGAVQGGIFDIAMSAMSDTRVREKQVDFIDYLLAGSGMLVHSGNPKHVFELAGLCGLTVDVQKGTSQESALETQSKACKAIGLGELKIKTFTTDTEAFKNFDSGNSDVHVTDYPVVAYLAHQSAGKYEIAGRQFNVVPFGIAVAKNNASTRDRLQRALASLIADGTYDKLLQKWSLAQGALRSAPVNAGTLFEK